MENKMEVLKNSSQEEVVNQINRVKIIKKENLERQI